MSPGPGTYVT